MKTRVKQHHQFEYCADDAGLIFGPRPNLDVDADGGVESGIVAEEAAVFDPVKRGKDIVYRLRAL